MPKTTLTASDYGLPCIYNGIHQFSHHNERGTRIVECADSTQEKLRQLERKGADLECRLGQQQVELDLHAQLIEITRQELGMDLKKFLHRTLHYFQDHKDMMAYLLNARYRAAGVSKQPVHQARARDTRFDAALLELIGAMDALMSEHPSCGLEKAYYTLRPALVGRDRFIALFQQLGYGCRSSLRRPRTTRSSTRRFPNRIEGRSFDGLGQVWQSDITYVDLGERFPYIVCTDGKRYR